jgi:hypothetical protein
MPSLRPHRRRVRPGGRRATGKMSDRSRRPNGVAKVKVISTGIVEVDGALDQPQSEQADVEVDIPLWITGDRRYMVKLVHWP